MALPLMSAHCLGKNCLIAQATPLLYAFSKPLQVCFEVSTQSAGERRRGGAGEWGRFGQPGTGATPLYPVASL